MAGVLATIFNRLGSPVEFNELVSGVAALLQIRDQPIESIERNENTIAFAAASEERDPAWQVEKRIFLQRLWEEVRQLPRTQRAALLLNLKDAEGARLHRALSGNRHRRRCVNWRKLWRWRLKNLLSCGTNCRSKTPGLLSCYN